MKLYRLIATVLLAILFSAPLSAQKAQIKIGYDYEVSHGGQVRKDDYILLSGTQGSMSYNPTALWMDINSKDDAACQAYGAIASALQEAGRGDEVPNRAVSMYVFKDFETMEKTVYDDFSDQFAKYKEPFEEMLWEVMADSTKTVLGYECMRAIPSYHGRHWKAWFAPEIPVDAGPWKLLGLPGLIMEAIDSTGQHHFTANGMESYDMPFPKVYEPYSYDNTTRNEFLKLCRYRYDNFQGMSDLHYGGNGPRHTQEKIEYESGKEGFDLLETDYR